jgi:hypothetical protein
VADLGASGTRGGAEAEGGGGGDTGDEAAGADIGVAGTGGYGACEEAFVLAVCAPPGGLWSMGSID